MRKEPESFKDTQALTKNPNIVERKIHGAYFLIDISDNYSKDKCALYEINEVGSFIWNQINNNRSIIDIAKELQKAIIDDIDLQILVDDTREFVESLIFNRFVEV